MFPQSHGEPDGHTLKPWAVQLLLKWHRQDPVSERETLRNDAVYGIQHNRNPFIDHPEYAAQIWQSAKPAPLVGVDANYSLEMEGSGKKWSVAGREEDLFTLLHRQGVNALRIRLWTKDDGPYGLNYATALALRAQNSGLKPHLVIFLSDNWADLVKQPAPVAWAKLPFQQKQQTVREYCERVMKHFQAAGIELDSVAIGNEIDFGICGEYEPEWSKRVSLAYMQKMVWPRMVQVLRAAQEGVLKAAPEAKFVLHLAQWDKPEYAEAFYTYMLGHGVRVDHLGLSYYPTAVKGEKAQFDFFFREAANLSHKLKRDVIVPEYAYPSKANFQGQFSAWNNPAPGYPLDEAGQKRWLQDFQLQVLASSAITATYYWSPEWFASPMWPAFALFDETGEAKPAIQSLGAFGS